MDKDRNTDPKRTAVALRYDADESDAPVVVAKGTGIIADKILKTAVAARVPVYRDRTLAGILAAVELNKQVPPEMYRAVAEVLAYVYRLDQAAHARRQP